MSSLTALNLYLRRLELRLRLFAAARGAAVVGLTACALTVLLVWICNRFQFADHIVLPLRIALFAGVALVLAFALVAPLLKVNRRWATQLAERHVQGLDQRLLTASEQKNSANPFAELLAEDALRIVRSSPQQDIVPRGWMAAMAACGVVFIGTLVWMIMAGPGYWGYGASLLWTGKPLAGARPLYEVVVQPGNKTVRRRSDQIVTAELLNFSAPKVVLHAKYRGSLKWEQAPMQAQPNGNGYQFLFAGLPDEVEYYVQAGPSRSKNFVLGVKDLPAVQRVRVALHYPNGLGLQDVVNDPGGDVRAVAGTEAKISVLTDRPLTHGELILDNGSKIPLQPGDGNWATAVVPVRKDGSYHVAAIDDGDTIRISDDYFIEAQKDEPAVVKIVSPGHDPHVSPIEELPVKVEATDDFGVKNLALHYSVNGGPEQTVPLSSEKSAKQIDGKTTLYLENFKMAPGDLVSFYATARDANTTSRTDIVFAQAEPFDFRFRQSQQAGGGGMQGGGDNEQISERQKEIIAATWNQVKSGPAVPSAVTENANFLSQLEGKLSEQAKTLSERMGRRELVAESPEFKRFSEAMSQASQEMANSVGALKTAKWQDALPSEQRALQSLLRAEATFRDIQIAYGNSGSSGMGSAGAGRDLAQMLDLELDKNKNQYETGNSGESSSSAEQQRGLDEALEKLKMLAQRQQELAAQRQPDQMPQQRWQEEQLRREAEQLRQQLQQLSKQQQSQSQGQQASNSSNGQAQSGSDSIRQASDALSRAEEEMRKATSTHDASSQRRAAEQLAEAAGLLKNLQQAQAGSSVSEMAERAQQIAKEQHDANEQARQMYGGRLNRSGSSSEASNGQMPEMTDPGAYSNGFRSWYWRQLERQPTRSATAQEKALASNKEKLGQELEELQRKMQQQAEGLQAQQPDVASKLLKALSNAEGEELALRMKKSAEWMREGYGARTYGMDDSVTKGVEQLSRDLQSAQEALNGGGKGVGDAQDQKTLEALNHVRKLREQLDRQAQQQGSKPAASGSKGPAIPYSSIQEAESAMSSLRQQLGPRDRDLSRQLTGTAGALRHLNDSRAGEMEARLNQEILPGLERLEAELSQRLSDGANAARTTAAEHAPEPYRDAVANYFRKLSQ